MTTVSGMTGEDRPVARRRLIAAGVLMALAAAAVLAVSALGGDDDGPKGKVPEAGSRFRSDSERQTLLDVLGPILGEGKAGSPRDQPLDRAVASLFVVGFEGRA